jgi:broad specificity phosphatase PhoE
MILLRHGQTVFNAARATTGIDPGVVDPGLTELGRTQAEAAAEALADVGVRRLVTSPYTRAIETAAILARALALPITVDARVRERMAYACDIGTTRSELARRWTALSFDHIDEVWWHAEEEPAAHLQSRCDSFRAEMARLPDWPRLAVVTHWGVIRALTGEHVTNGESIRFDPT